MHDRSYVQSMLFCDDVRVENTGKEIAIGIYPGGMSFMFLPIMIPQLVIRLELLFYGIPTESFALKVIDPNGNTLVEEQRPLSFRNWSMPGTVSIALQGVILGAAGDYKFFTKIPGEDWVSQRSLHVEKTNVEEAKARHIEFLKRMEGRVEEGHAAMSKAAN